MIGIKNNSTVTEFTYAETKIGRNKANHVILSAGSLKISRFHAVVKLFENVFFIKDVSVNETSEWGVYINKLPLMKNRWCELKVGDIVAFGAPTVEENGCITEIVEVNSNPKEHHSIDFGDIATQVSALVGSNNPQETIFDLTADEIINIEDDGSSIPPSQKKTAENTSTPLCILSSEEEDDEVVFSSPIRLVTTSHTTNNAAKENECKPMDVTSTMNGLLKPTELMPPPLPPAPVTPTTSSPDDIENQEPAMSFQQPILKQEFPLSQDTQELNYSMPDEIISLDSDEEDFPSSQLNTSCVTDMPDYSSFFSVMYELKSEVPSDDEDVKFIRHDTWFGPLSQTIEDVKPSLNKGLRKSDPVSENETSIDMEISQILDASDDKIEVVESPFSPITSSSSSGETAKPLQKRASKKLPRKITVISPQPRSKKRRSGDGDEERKKRKHDRESGSSPSKKHKHSSSRSSFSVTKEERKERLKGLCKDRPAKVEKVVKENKVIPKVKVTNKNRGAYLADLESSSSTSSSSPLRTANKIGTDVEPLISSKISDSKSERGGATKEHTESVHKREIPRTIKISTVSHGNNSSKVAFSPIADINSSKTLLPKLPITSRTARKSILKKSVEIKFYQKENKPGRSKKVKFLDQIISGCKEIDVDYEVSTLSQYKKYEFLIHKCSIEFDQALATILGWNVKWLQEQQKQKEPPPLYRIAGPKNGISDAVEKYKEELKCSMFHLIWKNIFANWNVPNNDDFPLTQVPGGGQVLNCYNIEIEKVEGSSKDSTNSLLTIYAKREILFFQAPDMTICGGKLVIMNLRIKKPPAENPVKSMAFAYIQSYNRRTDEGGHVFDQIILKMSAKPVHIVHGEAKMKVLNYTRQYLKQFQALGMTKSCPIIKQMCDVNFHDYLKLSNVAEIKPKHVNRFTRVLDPAQKRAVMTSLNCFAKDSSVSFIDGPCGTGKTQVIVSLLHELLSSNENKDTKILVITINDKLADDLVYRMCRDDRAKNVLRFGFCGGLNNNVKYCALDSKIEEILKNEGKDLIIVEEEIKIRRAHCNKLLAEARYKPEGTNGKIRQFEKEIEELGLENSKIVSEMRFQIAKEKALDAANVVVTSYGTCWTSNFENNFVPNNSNKGDINEFKICIIDDANFLDKHSMLIPLMLQVKHLILVGDRKIESYPNAPYHNMLRYFNLNNKDFITNLDEDHRMYPQVSQWVRQYFNLNTDLKVPIRKRRIRLKPFLIIDHTSSNVVNYQAVLCERLAKCIVEMDTEKLNFGVSVMVPRNSDKDNLRSILNTSNIQNRVRVDFFDGFSTRENDVIVLCLPASKISDQWLYIALTRAKLTVIICGDFEAIEAVPSITSLLNYAKKERVYFSLRNNADNISPEELKDILAL